MERWLPIVLRFLCNASHVKINRISSMNEVLVLIPIVFVVMKIAGSSLVELSKLDYCSKPRGRDTIYASISGRLIWIWSIVNL